MTCRQELQKLRDLAADPDRDVTRSYAQEAIFRLGYAAGYRDALGEALEIVDEHEDEE